MNVIPLVPDVLLPEDEMGGLGVRYEAMSGLLIELIIQGEGYYIWPIAAVLMMRLTAERVPCIRSRPLVSVRISSGRGRLRSTRREGSWQALSEGRTLDMGPINIHRRV